MPNYSKLLVSIVALYLSYGAFAYAHPQWIDFDFRKKDFPDAKYYVAMAENMFDKKDNPNEVVEALKATASSYISTSIRVNVESLTTSAAIEANDKVRSHFQKSVASYSNIELVGLKFETYINEADHKAYALAYVEKQQMNIYYVSKLKEQIVALKNQIANSQSYFDASNIKQAQTEYNKASALMNECRSIQSVLVAMGLAGTEDLQMEALANHSQTLNGLLLKIESGENRSLNDLAMLMAQNLQNALPAGTTLKLYHPTFTDTKFTSPFSKRFTQALQSELIKGGKTNIVEKATTNALFLKGTYWDENNNIRVSLSVADTKGNIHAATENLISKHYLDDNHIEYMAQNFIEAQKRLQDFRKDEIVDGNIKAEVWTDKGKDNLLYKEGEILKLYVRVNTPSYLRIIYYMADGSKVLLMDNYFIDQSKVNKVVELPDEFECAEPFGYETLQLSAQSKPFTPLQTQSQYGYDFITQSTKAIVAKTRGFKKVSNKDKGAETRLNITTYKE